VIAAGNPQTAADPWASSAAATARQGLYAAGETTGRQAVDFLQDHAVQARM
jgi:hypothetical protein